MRWITFFILLYVMAVLQIGVLGGVRHGDTAWPIIEYLPILTVFYALYASESAAPMCGLICGAVYDLGCPPALIGTHAVPLALIALLVVRVRLSIFREHFLSQFLITLLAIVGYDVLEVVMRVVIAAPLDGGSAWTQFGHMAASALYSSLLAPVFYWVFFRFEPLLGFTPRGARGRMHDGRR